jgi:hypothetical protein
MRHELAVQCADEEVILILRANQAGMRQAEEIEVLIARFELARELGRLSARGGGLRGHG